MKVLAVLGFLLVAIQAQTYDYQDALSKSILFYEAQRSGPLPDDNRIPFRSDSALDDFIVGGYYDAGDHVKFGFPLAGMLTLMSWGSKTFSEGYDKAGQTQYQKEMLQWGTDYLVAAHTAPEEFYGQVGDCYLDHDYWGRPEEMTMPRPAFMVNTTNPGSDLAGETAAALAAASMYYNVIGETAKADEALSHARELFDFANTYRGNYSDAIPVQDFYNSWSGYNDELVWSAAWMAKATGESSYLDLAEQFHDEFGLNFVLQSGMSWDNKIPGVQILLWELTQDDKYLAEVDAFFDFMLHEATYTPMGLLYLDDWGSIGASVGQAHLALQVAALGHRTDELQAFAESQIDYLLGDTGKSFMIGFGENFPQFEHHRAASCFDQP